MGNLSWTKMFTQQQMMKVSCHETIWRQWIMWIKCQNASNLGNKFSSRIAQCYWYLVATWITHLYTTPDDANVQYLPKRKLLLISCACIFLSLCMIWTFLLASHLHIKHYGVKNDTRIYEMLSFNISEWNDIKFILIRLNTQRKLALGGYFCL